MKLSCIAITATVASVYGAVLPRQEQAGSTYPNSTDLSSMNGIWHDTAVSNNLAGLLAKVTEKSGISLGCDQYYFSDANKTAAQFTASAWLTRNGTGDNITSAGEFLLAPAKQVNVSDHQVTLQVYLSQFFTNGTAFRNLDPSSDDDQSHNNNSTNTTIAVPGTKPMSLVMNAKLISSNNDSNFDNVFYWYYDTEDQGKDSDDNEDYKISEDWKDNSGSEGQDGSGSTLYASLMSKSPSLSDDEYNHVLSQFPSLGQTNWNQTFTRLNNTCH